MTETVVAVESSQNPEVDAAIAALIDVPDRREVDELEVARELVRQAREAGVALTGPGGLLKAMTKTVSEPALDEELSEHLGYDRHDPAGYGSGNSRNGTRALHDVQPVQPQTEMTTSLRQPTSIRKSTTSLRKMTTLLRPDTHNCPVSMKLSSAACRNVILSETVVVPLVSSKMSFP
ncbi:hypothetical protein FHT44_006311 [Mycolicibacterium sp. BK634]|nr:hypothetical protein [Mycolicibacterium sp. BK634]